MRVSWTQTAAGALTCAVVAGLLMLPGQLLGPSRGGQPLHLQAEAAPKAVQAAPVPVVKKHRAPKQHAVAHPAPTAQLASFVVTQRARVSRTVVRNQTAPKQAVFRHLRHLALPVDEARPASTPTPAPTPTPS